MSCLTYRIRPAGDRGGDSTRLCRWCWYRPVAARGVVQRVYATARPGKDTAHPHASVRIKDHYGGVHSGAGEHHEGEGETD